MAFLPSAPNATLLDLFKAYPDLSGPLHEFAQTLMQGPSPFSEGERELIAAYVSARNDCHFCQAAHIGIAERFGVEPGVLEALRRDVETAGVAEKLKPVFRYVQKLNDTPASVGQRDVDAILAAGWDETAVVHAALVCGFFNLMNRWVDGLGIPADPKVAKMAADHIHKKGYRGILEFLKAG